MESEFYYRDFEFRLLFVSSIKIFVIEIYLGFRYSNFEFIIHSNHVFLHFHYWEG